MIGIINYGLGNVNALNIFNKLGIDNFLVNNTEDFKKLKKFFQCWNI